jgi:hypothetical protein
MIGNYPIKCYVFLSSALNNGSRPEALRISEIVCCYFTTVNLLNDYVCSFFSNNKRVMLRTQACGPPFNTDPVTLTYKFLPFPRASAPMHRRDRGVIQNCIHGHLTSKSLHRAIQ